MMQLVETGRSVSYGRFREDGLEQHIVLDVMSSNGFDVVVVSFDALDEAIGMGGWKRDDSPVVQAVDADPMHDEGHEAWLLDNLRREHS